MKFAGLMSLCSAIALTGLYLSFIQGKRLKLIKELCTFFRDAEKLCGAGLSDLTGIFVQLSAMQKYKELKAVFNELSRYENGENLKEIWDGAIRTYCPFYINSETKSLLFSFSDSFGKCTRDSFIRMCSDFYGIAEDLLVREQKRYEQNRSMTVYSGVLTAAAIFFIFS